ncbi:MAG: hypothetical protein JWS12_576 [Candidatus Saccharibacteria bacterium]|nr:hypothetical protein [Candidatus Saccharibacteria bacterium]
MKICRQYATEDKQEDLRKLGRLWSRELGNKGNELGLGIGLNLNGEPLTRKKLIHLWVNGDYMHLDDQASESLALMRGNPFIGMAELIFIAAMQNLAILLFNLDGRFIDPLLNEAK